MPSSEIPRMHLYIYMLTSLYKKHTGIENNTVESLQAENKQKKSKSYFTGLSSKV